jgi:ABC-type Fe3+/spermidine/putrescine transport system ATPase subunit
MTHVPAKSRGVGLVFQNYALFRHMTVGENVEFALRVRGVKRQERQRRRQELLGLVDLDGFGDRMPGELSGGQQQRIAVARALAHEPAVLLMDEPFGALDAKIRVEPRETIRQVQRRLGMTTILVTHDQEEAFALADRIGVMHNGRLLEVGRAERLYRFPATRFVATFLGAANLVLGQLSEEGLRLGAARISAAESLRSEEGSQEVVTVIRPEDIEVAESEHQLRSAPFASGTVQAIGFGGGLERLRVQLMPETGLESAVHPDMIGAASAPLVIEVVRPISEQAVLPIAIGRAVTLGIRRFHLLPTPISSYRITCADGAAARIMAQPLFRQLLNSMRARVLVPGEAPPDETPETPFQSGVTVLSVSPDLLDELHTALGRGTRRLLCLPTNAGLPQRVLIYCDSEASRRATLGMVASILRHLPAEATFVSVQSAAAERAEVANSFRRVLDARAELLEFHGLDIRTDVQIGELNEWVARIAAAPEGALIVLGLSGTTAMIEGQLRGAFAPLFTVAGRHAVLLSCHSGGLAPTGVGETSIGAKRQTARSANA